MRLGTLRWLILGLLFLSTVINYVDRQTLSVLLPTLRKELGLTSADYGTITTVFMLAYALAQIPAGMWIDRIGTRIGFCVSIVGWSLAAMLHAFARGPLSLVFFRGLLGVTEAGNWPAGTKAVASWIPQKQRALGQIAKKLEDKNRPPAGNGKTSKTARPPAGGDAFWSALSDMHPRSLGRRETIQRLTAQKDGLGLALRQAQVAAAELPEHEAAFLGDNLIYQSAIMVQTCAWLEQVELAHEAIDLEHRPACAEALAQAEAAFARIPVLAEGYCRGEWQDWYRGCKKLNVSATLKRTREVLEQAKQG